MSNNPIHQLDQYFDLVQLNQILPDLQLRPEEIGYLMRLRMLIGRPGPHGEHRILLRSALELVRVRIRNNQL